MLKNEINENKALNKTDVIGCFSYNSFPTYENAPNPPEQNRIKCLFKDFEIRNLGLKKVTKIISKELGARFQCNRIEVDWLTEELKKPLNQDTQDFIDFFKDKNCKTKVIVMKKSEELKINAHKEENDLVFMGKMKKVFREQRLERFEDKFIERLRTKGYEVENISEGKYLIRTTTKYGNIEYYPKANRVFVKLHSKQNNKGWYSKGLNWITECLLK